MLKHIIALIVLSLLAVVGMDYVQQVLDLLISAHTWISDTLMRVFSVDDAGIVAKNLIALLCMPLVIALIPSLIYWLIKRKWFPYFFEIAWIIWLVQIGALASMYVKPT
ncbi:MAG: hypothetical protein A3E83_02625 [Gammaproteobacteria bacterium RIFCSPHIGHO2_12_FULL_41_20]|nr:MAG: hypothetical protein A3E83_02625 [Gammaproteobacteria bacterium RIFCSPHIGHO2_12_FULL_41_20]